MSVLPYGRQSIDGNDIQAVVEVLKSNWITQGPRVEYFEEALAKYCGARYAVAVSSGTAALHLACLALNLKKNEEAITSPLTFLSTANAVLYVGAKPVFADIDPLTLNIDSQEVLKRINKRTRILLPVHFAGRPCDMASLNRLAQKNGLRIIEDAAHALGARYKVGNQWYKVGSCQHSDMTIFSFHPVKHITTGEGGAITTNDQSLYKKLQSLREHGIVRNDKNKVGPWYYEMRYLGLNYRITDFQCALGLSQLKRLDDFVEKRRSIAGEYIISFTERPQVRIILESKNVYGSYHLFVLLINFGKIKRTRKTVMQHLRKKGISTQVHYIPIYLQPYYRKLGYKTDEFPMTNAYYRECLSIPIYPAMTEENIARVIREISDILVN